MVQVDIIYPFIQAVFTWRLLSKRIVNQMRIKGIMDASIITLGHYKLVSGRYRNPEIQMICIAQ